MKNCLFLLTTVFVLTFSTAQAAVINYADVAGLRTFQDTTTGRIWLDMDNFFDVTATNGITGFAMIAIAQEAGFTFATRNDVSSLLSTLPLDGGQWSSYASVMGYGHPRELIWGMYDDGANPFGWAFAHSLLASWTYADNVADANVVQGAGGVGTVDMGIWAYQTNTTLVPEPTSLLLLGTGLGAAGLMRRRRR